MRVKYLGKKGALTELLKNLGKLPSDERPEAGRLINIAKGDVTSALEQRKAALEAVQLEAQLADAQWSLDRTVLRAPHSGYLVDLQVRPGVAVRTFAGAPAASFISDEIKDIVASFSQSSIRRIQPGDAAEMVFSMIPGEVFPGTITHVVKASGSAQMAPSGNIAVLTGQPVADRYGVRIELDDPEAIERLPQGASCIVTAYTDRGKPFHVISKVVMRMNAWKAYLTSPV